MNISVLKLIRLRVAKMKQRPLRPTFSSRMEFIPIEAIDDIPINVNPTLHVLIPPLAPKSLAKIVGKSTKCAPSRLKEIHTSARNSVSLTQEFFKFITIGKVKPIIT